MNVPVKTLLNLYRFPSGRRLSCLRSMRERLADPAFAELQSVLDRAIASEWATRDLEIRYRNGMRQRNNEFSDETSALDLELDRALSALDDALGVALKAYGEGSPQGEAATLLRSTLFGQGVRFLIHMPFMEQEAEVAVLLERAADEPSLAEAVRVTRVEPLVERIAELNRRFGEAIRDGRPVSPASFEEVRAARDAGHERLGRIVILVPARLLGAPPDGEHAEALAAALQVVQEQNAAIKRYRKRRRGVNGLDPEEEFDEPDAEVEEAPRELPSVPTLALRERPSAGDAEAA
ncbi:MAG: hypothetical protein R3F62_01375 [Planctomycetota bacterium]